MVLGVRVGRELAFDRELAAAMVVPGNLVSGRIRALVAAAVAVVQLELALGELAAAALAHEVVQVRAVRLGEALGAALAADLGVIEVVQAGALARVELLELVRLESDEVTVTWRGHVFESSLGAVVVQQ